MERTTDLILDPDGVPVLCHRAPPGPAADGLRHEAAVLERARGLGVVELVELVEEPGGGVTLVTQHVPGGTLADTARVEGERAALAALSRVATILAELHDAGIVHGRCTSDHVVGRGADLVLCGLRCARMEGTEGRPDRRADLEAFQLLVRDLCEGETELARRANRAAAGLVGSPGTNLRVVSGELAALAGVERPAPARRRLEPRRPRTQRRGARTEPRARPGTEHVRRAVAGAAVAIGLGLLGGMALRAPGGPPAPGAIPGAATQGDAAPGGTASGGIASGGVAASEGRDEPEDDHAAPPLAPRGHASRRPVQVWPKPSHADVGGDVREAPAPLAAGVVEHEGVRYQVGGAGDLIVVGDWDCDGAVTPSVVRPADGSVWTFPAWADGGQVLTARPLGYAPAPVAAVTAPGPDGCDVIAITTRGGGEVLVDPA